MAGYVQVSPPEFCPDDDHKAWLVEGKFLPWPKDDKDAIEKKLGVAKYKQNCDTSDTLRFTQTKEPPCTTIFVDGCGVTHSVTIKDADSTVQLTIPLPDETFTRHINTYKQIVWQFDNGGDDPSSTPGTRSCTPPGSTLAECTFKYQPGSILHNHGIRIRVQAYSLGERSDKHTDQEKAFWEGDVLKEAAPFLHKYFKLVKEHALETAAEAQKTLTSRVMDPSEADPYKSLGKMMKVAQKLQEEQQRKKIALNEELGPVILKAFTHHDKTGTHVLDREEAATFFSHIVDEQGAFQEASAAVLQGQAVQEMTKAMMDMTKMMGGKVDKKAEKAKADAMVHEMLEATRELVEKAMVEYKNDKQAKDATAFKVLDISGEGTLKSEEVVVAMTQGSAKNVEFMTAIGFGPDLAMQAMKGNSGIAMQGMMGATGPDCPTQ
jgi:hypothetical protein